MRKSDTNEEIKQKRKRKEGVNKVTTQIIARNQNTEKRSIKPMSKSRKTSRESYIRN